jgi:hypothetical protein
MTGKNLARSPLIHCVVLGFLLALLPLLQVGVSVLASPGGPGRAFAPHPVHDGLFRDSQDLLRTFPLQCIGDGRSGKRVQLVYVRERSQPSGLALQMPYIQAIAAQVDLAFNLSAIKLAPGDTRHVRFVTEATPAGCKAVIVEAVVPDGTLSSPRPFDATKQALLTLRFNSPDRKYLVFSEGEGEAGGSGGQADAPTDTRKSPNNRQNGIGFAVIYRQTWASPDLAYATEKTAHELMHTFGAVAKPPKGSPNATPGHHCTDENDIMCYSDKDSLNQLPPMKFRCTGPTGNLGLPFFDCRGDDYFNPRPKPGSYLARNWNAADSAYLEKPSPVGGVRAGRPLCGPGPSPAIGDKLDVNPGDGYPIDIQVSSPGRGFVEHTSRLWVDGSEIPLNYRDHLSDGDGGRVRYAPAILLGLQPDDRVEHTVILALEHGDCYPAIRVWTLKAVEHVTIDMSPEGTITSRTARPQFTLEIPGSSIYPLYPVLWLDETVVYHPNPQYENQWTARRIQDRWVWTPSSDIPPGKHRLRVDWWAFPSAYGPTDQESIVRNRYLPPTIGFAPALKDSLPPWEFELIVDGKGT